FCRDLPALLSELVPHPGGKALDETPFLRGVVWKLQLLQVRELGDGRGRHTNLAELLIRVSGEERLRIRRYFPYRGEHHDLAFELAFPGRDVLIEVRL